MGKLRASIAGLAAALALSACTWVDLSPEGEKVVVLTKEEVAKCKKVGQTVVMLRDSVAGFERSDKKVRHELNTLARNSASEIGGDAVVPIGEPQDGKQTFGVYDCRP